MHGCALGEETSPQLCNGTHLENPVANGCAAVLRPAGCPPTPCTLRLPPLVVHVQRGAPVHPRHHVEVGAVEAVHSDNTGLGVEVAFV